jgi:DNA-directed RNA polymerase specialized sigma24 family protein
MKNNYQRALSYAWKCNPALCRDFVHQAYIQNYNKDGTNLFEDKGIYYILRCVRNVWFTYIRDSRFQYRGEHYRKQWFEVTDNLNSAKTPSPQALLESKEFIENFHKQLTQSQQNKERKHVPAETLHEVVRLLEEGYNKTEIAEILNTSPQVIGYYSKKIKTVINRMNNPLRTSTVPILKTITRRTYETSELYKAFKYDKDTCDHNEYYEIVTDGKDFILVREKEGEIFHESE